MKNTYKRNYILYILIIAFKISYGQTKILNGSVFIKNNSSLSLKTSSLDFNSILSLNENHTFKKEKIEKKNILKFNHYYKGIKVYNSTLLVHMNEGQISSINGNIQRFKDIETHLNLTDKKALEIAKSYLNVTSLNNIYPIETVIAKLPNSDIKTVKKVRIDSSKPFEMCYLLISNNGEVLNKINLYTNEDVEGTGHTLYHGVQNISLDRENNNYTLTNNTHNYKTLNLENGLLDEDFVNNSSNWSNMSAEIDAHWGMGKTHDFYVSEFSRNSYDNNGSELKQYLNEPGLENNAYAAPAPYNYLSYGSGDGVSTTPFVSLDIIGHEFTHLVIENNGTGGLVYQGESGALNESFADIFGTCVEFFSTQNANWIMGEDVFVNNTPIRSMSNPKQYNNPDTYGGDFWVDPFDIFYDNGGVHINSGIQNYWFYLLSEGGSGTNDNGDSYNISAIGLEKASQIAYRNLTNYLTSNSTFLDAYFGSIQAAEDLYGFASTEYNTVIDAWNAVGVNEDLTYTEFCSGTTILTENSGTISDGSENQNYRDNANCEWLIEVEDDFKIILEFTEFNTENDYDYVHIYDGDGSSSNLLGQFSGNSIPENIISSSNKMFISFTSDEFMSESGWSANYYSTDEEIFCSGNTILTEPSGTLSDGSGNENYSNFSNCSWLIQPDNADGITLEFSEFNLEQNDYLRIYDGSTNWSSLIGTYTGSTIPQTINSSSGSLYIEFSSDDELNNTGWTANYTATISEHCFGTTNLTDASGSFSDGSGNSSYRNNANCEWLIEVEDNLKIILEFTEFNTESCCDRVRVYDGNSSSANLLGEFAGTNIPESIRSSSNSLFVRFTSDGSVTSSGWSANYYSTDEEIFCSGNTILTEPSGTLSDGSGNENYSNFSNCSWLIQPDNADGITLEFSEFNLEQNDYLRIYDGSTNWSSLIGTYTGSTIPQTINSSSGSLYIEFSSDDELNNTGWTANYTATISEHCFGTTNLTDASGSFSDGSGNSSYRNNANCEWIIEVDPNSTINLEFSEFNLENGFDYVTVYDGDDDNGVMINRFTGNDIPEAITSSSNSLYINFTSDDSITRTGWTANYETSTLSNQSNIFKEVKIYPNPTNTFLNIETEQEVAIKMYSILGKLILELNKESHEIKTIDTSSLKKGVYLLEIEGERSKLCKRIVKN